MADAERLICKSEALVDSGDGVRFDVDYGKGRESAFVVRFMGEAIAVVVARTLAQAHDAAELVEVDLGE